jgi:hypothetical protein
VIHLYKEMDFLLQFPALFFACTDLLIEGPLDPKLPLYLTVLRNQRELAPKVQLQLQSHLQTSHDRTALLLLAKL